MLAGLDRGLRRLILRQPHSRCGPPRAWPQAGPRSGFSSHCCHHWPSCFSCWARKQAGPPRLMPQGLCPWPWSCLMVSPESQLEYPFVCVRVWVHTPVLYTPHFLLLWSPCVSVLPTVHKPQGLLCAHKQQGNSWAPRANSRKVSPVPEPSVCTSPTPPSVSLSLGPQQPALQAEGGGQGGPPHVTH